MIKKIGIFIFTLLLGLNIFGQDEQLNKSISESFKNNHAENLTDYLNSLVNLELLNYDDNFSKKQTIVILQEFFDSHPSTDFSINHTGSSNDGSKYFIATYKTQQTSYRVYFLLKKKNNTFIIHQIQFEEE